MRPVILIVSVLLLAPAMSVTALALPPFEAGQRVSIETRNPSFSGSATVVSVATEAITLKVIYVSRGPSELKGTIIVVPLADIVKVRVVDKSKLVAAYVGLAVLLLIPVVLWLIFFLKFDKEQRRQRFQLARVPLMTFLGGIVGLFIGGALIEVMGLENHELRALGGTGGLPADKIIFVGCMLVFGSIFYSRAKKRKKMD